MHFFATQRNWRRCHTHRQWLHLPVLTVQGGHSSVSPGITESPARGRSSVLLFCKLSREQQKYNLGPEWALFFFLILTEDMLRERKRRGEGEGEREISIGCLPHAPDQGRNLKPRYVPWPGVEQATFRSQDDSQPTEPLALSYKGNFHLINVQWSFPGNLVKIHLFLLPNTPRGKLLPFLH